MFFRIFNKLLYVLNTYILKFHELLESKGWMKKIEPETTLKEEKTENVNLRFPANFKQPNAPLFEHANNYHTNELKLYRFKQVNVSLDGIVFRKMNNSWLNMPHVLFRAQYGWLYLLKNYWFYKKESSKGKTFILLFDFWSAHNYYHWLVDALPRLLMVMKEAKDPDYLFLLPAKCPKFILGTLKLYGIDQIFVLKKNHYLKGVDAIVPEYVAGSGHLHPSKVIDVKKHLMQSVQGSGKHERIYVSRSRAKARRIVNEAEVIAVLKQHKFEVLYFENLSFEEQVLMVRNAKYYVSSHGANMTNLMFMQEGSGVLELIREDQPNFCYWALSEVCQMRYYYQLCPIAERDHLFVNIPDLKLNLGALLHD